MYFKMEKITVLFGSPHTNSYTAELLNCFINSAEKINGNCEITTINAYKRNIKPCIDCKKCCENGTCIYSDMDDILKSINESDLIIIAFPIYNSSIPAPLKSIIDRFQQRYNAKHFGGIELDCGKQKSAIILTTQGANEEVDKQIILAQIKPMLRLCGISNWQYFNLKDTDNIEFDKKSISKICEPEMKNIFENIIKQRSCK